MRLKSRLDANDHFMSGHGIVKARTYKRKVPLWAMNDARVKALILRAFPKVATSKSHHDGAARWAAVIQLYFRLGYTRPQIAEELGSTVAKVHGIIRSILRVSKGLRADGTGYLKRGMPYNSRTSE